MNTKSRNGLLAGLSLVAISSLVISKKRKHREADALATSPDGSTTTSQEMHGMDAIDENRAANPMTEAIDPSEAQAIE
ncbi:MAG TPA: LPXTG cell wall anchor domain-containing protein [Dehalococcoidia bacterium]|jgi:LPXTG-motif cell wall-anchored protein|nr:LPXTG cell wall anchor domain-containing protein [Dehalococcoidia bacterium]